MLVMLKKPVKTLLKSLNHDTNLRLNLLKQV